MHFFRRKDDYLFFVTHLKDKKLLKNQPKIWRKQRSHSSRETSIFLAGENKQRNYLFPKDKSVGLWRRRYRGDGTVFQTVSRLFGLFQQWEIASVWFAFQFNSPKCKKRKWATEQKSITIFFIIFWLYSNSSSVYVPKLTNSIRGDFPSVTNSVTKEIINHAGSFEREKKIQRLLLASKIDSLTAMGFTIFQRILYPPKSQA